MHQRAWKAGRLKPQPNLDALDGLHRHHGLRKTSVQLLRPLGMRTEPKWQPHRTDFHHATQRVPVPFGSVDEFLTGGFVFRGAQRKQRVAITQLLEFRQQFRLFGWIFRGIQRLEKPFRLGQNLEIRGSNGAHEAEHVDSQRGQQLTRQPTRRHTRGRFSSAGPFQNRPHAGEVLPRAAQISMAGPWTFQIAQPRQTVVPIFDPQRNGTAQRQRALHAGQNLDRVGFQRLPPAASVATLTPLKLAIDHGRVDVQPCGKTVHQCQKALTVRLTGCFVR